MCQTRLSGFVCCKYLNISIDIPPGPAPAEGDERLVLGSSCADMTQTDSSACVVSSLLEKKNKTNKQKKESRKKCCQIVPRPSPSCCFKLKAYFVDMSHCLGGTN